MLNHVHRQATVHCPKARHALFECHEAESLYQSCAQLHVYTEICGACRSCYLPLPLFLQRGPCSDSSTELAPHSRPDTAACLHCEDAFLNAAHARGTARPKQLSHQALQTAAYRAWVQRLIGKEPCLQTGLHAGGWVAACNGLASVVHCVVQNWHTKMPSTPCQQHSTVASRCQAHDAKLRPFCGIMNMPPHQSIPTSAALLHIHAHSQDESTGASMHVPRCKPPLAVRPHDHQHLYSTPCNSRVLLSNQHTHSLRLTGMRSHPSHCCSACLHISWQPAQQAALHPTPHGHPITHPRFCPAPKLSDHAWTR